MDVSVIDLWLPILVSAVAVFFASAIAWMALPHHNKDIRGLPKDSPIPEHTKGLDPGLYMWPHCADRAELKSEQFKRRFEEGPWGSLNVTGKPNMAANMAGVLVVYLVISVFVAYITGLARPAGADFVAVFRVAGPAAMAAYCFGWMPGAIFFAKPGRFWLTDLADSVVYALLTAAIFAALWPGAGGVEEVIRGAMP